MSFIFTKFDVKSIISKINSLKPVEKAFSFVKSNRVLVKITSFILIGIIGVIISFASTGLKFGFKVNYSGKVIATVSNTEVFENAKNIALKNVKSEKADKVIDKPSFSLTLTSSNQLASPAALAEAIIENSKDLTYGSALIVNGETLICTAGDDLEHLYNFHLNEYNVDGALNLATYVDDVKIQKGYYLKSELDYIVDAVDIIDSLEVKTVSTKVLEETVDFPVKKIMTSSYENGYHKVTKQGENGLTRTTTVTETVNGVATTESKVSSQVVTAPVEQIEVFGTAAPKVSASQKASAKSNGFIVPLNRGTYKITSYYGDGRNHKGIDLAAKTGVPIFAVADGVVTYSGYDSDFGYNVIIEHNNGIKTRYAHASALCVAKGARVSQGDMIAAVGNTGYSTGSHLHFEVIVNGVRVNPAPYIGM